MHSFYKKVFSFLFIGCGLFLFAHVGFAQESDMLGMEFGEATGLGSEDPRVVAANIVRIFLAFLGIIALSLMIYAGFLWMTSEGNAEKVEKAKNILKGAIIGLLIVLSAFAIASFIISQLLSATTGDTEGGGGEGGATIPPGGGGGGSGISCDGNPVTDTCEPADEMCGEDEFCSPDNCTCQTGGGLGDSCDASPQQEDTCDADNDMCQEHLVCEPEADCTCQGAPVIEGISPIGGFCSGDVDTFCVDDDDCPDSECDTSTPNGAPGNLVTIAGQYFGTSTGEVYFSDGEDTAVEAGLPSEENPNCEDNWQEGQIIVVVPDGAEEGAVQVVRSDGETDTTDNDRGPLLSDFVVNDIERPGLCALDPDSGVTGDSITYYGLNLNEATAYFGDYDSNKQAVNSSFTSSLEGEAEIPLITAGDTTTFGEQEDIPSNFLDFIKEEEPDTGPVINYFEPVDGPPGQYVTIYGDGFGNNRGEQTVYFGDEVSGVEADFDFPEVCGDEIWTDDQVVVKVPQEIDNGEYIITMDLTAEVINSQNVTPTDERSSTFEVDDSLSLAPGLCKLEPVMGTHNIPVSLWGEYFGEDKDTVRFYPEVSQTGDNIEYWGPDEEDGEAQRVDTSVPEEAASGPVRIVRDGNESNGMNFEVGECNEAEDPDAACGGQICCPPETYKADRCADDHSDCSVNIPTSVYEWEFDTGGGGAEGDPCYADASSTPDCNPGNGPCGTDLVCDPSSCVCVEENGNGTTTTSTSPQLGEVCEYDTSTTTETCDTSICPDPFGCFNEDGSGPLWPDDCGVCCCEPGEGQCSSLGTGLNCQADRGNCTGEERGLCCGCETDVDCGAEEVIGCGDDTCCHARPEVDSTSPADGEEDVCANGLISAEFDQRMKIDSFTGNVIVVGEYEGSCPDGTQYLAEADTGLVEAGERHDIYWEDKPISGFFYGIHATVQDLFNDMGRRLSMWWRGEQALADTPDADKNYCAVEGSVSGRHIGEGKSEMTFSSKELLDTDRKYFVIVQGDEGLDSGSGVLSEWGVGMNGSHSETFNSIEHENSHIWSFTTLPDQGNNGVCAIDRAEIDPSSYLFQTTDNDPNENDSDPDSNSFDTVRDRDKVFTASALNEEDVVLTPVSGYSWDWNWSIDDTAVADINSDPFDDQNRDQLVQAEEGATDHQTKVRAEVDLTETDYSDNGDGEEGESDVRVFLCNNPWPPVADDGTWDPWTDQEGNCTAGEGSYCPNMNFEMYYCRDQGGEGTADDLPAITVDGKVRYCDIPGVSDDCEDLIEGGSSLSQNTILKEAYFFREKVPEPDDIGNLAASAPSEGGKVDLSWDWNGSESVDHYNIYYGTSSGWPYDNSASADTESVTLDGLTNDTTYYFAVTAVFDSGAESDLSEEESATPEDTEGSEAPSIEGVSGEEDNIYVGWSDASDGEATSFKLYYSASDSCGPNINFGGSTTIPFDDSATSTITGISPETSYCVGMTSMDVDGNSSATSTIADLEGPIYTATTPTIDDISADDTEEEITLEWANNGHEDLLFHVYHSTSTGTCDDSLDFEHLGETNDTTFTADSLSVDTSHCFGVTSENNYGDESEMDILEGAISIPVTPVINDIAVGSDVAEVNWSDESGNSNLVFNIYSASSTPSSCEPSFDFDDSIESPFSDTATSTVSGLSSDTDYCIGITSENEIGEESGMDTEDVHTE